MELVLTILVSLGLCLQVARKRNPSAPPLGSHPDV
jgi:hypothetical protein